MNFYDNLRKNCPQLSRESRPLDAQWTAGPITWGGGRFCVAAEALGSDPVTAVRQLRDTGAVLLHLMADPAVSLDPWFDAAQGEGLPVLLDLKAWTDAVPDPLGAIVSQNFPPIPTWVLQQTGRASAVLADASHTAHHPFVRQLIQDRKGLFYLRRSLPLDQWLAGAESLVAGGLENLVLTLQAENPWQTGPSEVLDLLPGLRRILRYPLVYMAEACESEKAPILAAAAAGAHGLILSSSMSLNLSDLIEDLRGVVQLLGLEFPRVPKKAEGLSTVLGVSYAALDRDYRVAFQGERGAYSEMAVNSRFPKDRTTLLPCKVFRETYDAVLRGEVDYAVLPYENALAGSITDNYDLILQYPDLHIVGETKIRIEHNLIGMPGTELKQIKKVLSHPQGLAQSQAFLDAHPDWERVTFYDTAGAVAHVAQTGDPSLAAIASAEAARVYNMEILQAGIETNHRNCTRFVIVAPLGDLPLGTLTKASVVFSTADSPGALAQCLGVFAQHGLNLNRLESRPIHGKPWSYMFFADVEIPGAREAFDLAISDLASKTEDLRVLGVYPTV